MGHAVPHEVMSQKPRRHASRHGQTLIELFVVLLIFGVLATAITLLVRTRLDAMRTDTAGRQLQALERAFQRFHQKHGHYPEPPDGIRALVESGTIETLEKDPWGNDLVYREQGNALVILSYGKDGKPGGEGADADHSVQIAPLFTPPAPAPGVTPPPSPP